MQAFLQNVNFTSNTASTQGGGVFHSAATGNMTDVFLISNQGNDGVSRSPCRACGALPWVSRRC